MIISVKDALMKKDEDNNNDSNTPFLVAETTDWYEELISGLIAMVKGTLVIYNVEGLSDTIRAVKIPTDPAYDGPIYLISGDKFDLHYHPKSGVSGISITVSHPKVREYLKNLPSDTRIEFIKTCGKHSFSFKVKNHGSPYIDTYFYICNINLGPAKDGAIIIDLIEGNENERWDTW